MPDYDLIDYDPVDVDSYINAKKTMGLSVIDEEAARRFITLNGIHYFDEYSKYRLADVRNGQQPVYRGGTGFEQIVSAIDFDNRLKDLLMRGVRSIELWLRSELCYNVALHFDNEAWYLDNTCLHQFAPHSFKLDRWRAQAQKACKELGLPQNDSVPLWEIAHELSFGFWSHGYELLHEREKEALARQLDLTPSTLENWLMQIVGIRNRCSHHRMVWAHIYSGISRPDDEQLFQALLKNSIKAPNPMRLDRLAMRLYAMHFILRAIDQEMQRPWTAELKDILAGCPTLSLTGLRPEWSQQPEWG